MKIAPETLYQSEYTKNAFDIFKNTLKTEDTKKEYKDTLRNFCNYVERDFLDINEKDAKKYKEYMELKNLSVKTIYSRISMLTSFTNYLIKNPNIIEPMQLDINVFDKLERPNYSVYIPPSQIPTLEEMDKIYSAAKTAGDMYYCIMLLASRCALTREEIINLKVNHFIKDTNLNLGILFKNKYSDRFIKIPMDVFGILDNYERTIRINHGPYFFYNNRGTMFKPNTLSKKITDIIHGALGDNKYSLQSLRDFAITTMRTSGASEHLVATYIGIGSEWIQRYNKAVEEFVLAPCDLVNIIIKE